jgi:histone H3/H4
MDALRATMADEVDAEVVDRAVKAAQNAVQPVLEQVQRHAAAIAEAAGETP